MSLEAFLGSLSDLTMPMLLPVHGDGSLLEALSSTSPLNQQAYLDSILRIAQLNTTSNAMHSTLTGHWSFPTGAYLQNYGNNYIEPYISLPSPLSFSSNHPISNPSTAETTSHLCHSCKRGKKRPHMEKSTDSTDVSKSASKKCRDSHPTRIKQEDGLLVPIQKNPRFDVNQDNVMQQQQHIIQELLLKEFQDQNARQKATFKQHRRQNELQQPILHSVPQRGGLNLQLSEKQTRNLIRDQSDQQLSSSLLLDGGICSRRLMQYMYHLRTRPHDNNMAYWKNFVSEYYATGSRKRWCFSTYGNIERNAIGVFCPKSMENWCCEMCGSRPGKGLEATFDIFPRLLKMKFESGMIDEIMFLDFPLARKVSSGLLVLEYSKAVQESVYQNFRVIHEGKLRVVFSHDLKILSWEFCTRNHEEFLLRRSIIPQVDQLVQAAHNFGNVFRNGVPFIVSKEELQRNCDVFVSAGHKLARDMELPLVNDLGYPKRYIRCLQIAEVVNTMRDLITFSHVTKMGPIESLNNYCKSSKTDHKMATQENQQFMDAQYPGYTGPGSHAKSSWMTDYDVASGSGKLVLTSANINNQLSGQNSSIALARRKGQEFSPKSINSHQYNDTPPYRSPGAESSEHAKNPHQMLIDQLLREMVVASRGKSTQDAYQKPNKETGSQLHRHTPRSSHPGPTEHRKPSKSRLAETSNSDSAQMKLDKASRRNHMPEAGNSSAVTRCITVKTEPCSPEQLPDAFLSLAAGFSNKRDFQW